MDQLTVSSSSQLILSPPTTPLLDKCGTSTTNNINNKQLDNSTANSVSNQVESSAVVVKTKLSRNSSAYSAKSRYSLRSSASSSSSSTSSALASRKKKSSLTNNNNNVDQSINADILPVITTSISTNNPSVITNSVCHTVNMIKFDTHSIDTTNSASIYSLNKINNASNSGGGGGGANGGGAGSLALGPTSINTNFSFTTSTALNNIGTTISNNNNSDVNSLNGVVVKDPILIRGAGNITIFGVCNKFNEQFPPQLTAKLAPEEFRDTIKQINSILNKELANSFKWLVIGSIFCCCTLGCSLIPVIFMNKKAKLSINKLLEMENQRIYLKLGLKWRLKKLKCNSSNSLLEYVLLIEFLPTILLYQPD